MSSEYTFERCGEVMREGGAMYRVFHADMYLGIVRHREPDSPTPWWDAALASRVNSEHHRSLRHVGRIRSRSDAARLLDHCMQHGIPR